MFALKPLIAGLLAVVVIAPATAGSYHFRVAAKGVIAPSTVQVGSLTPNNAFNEVPIRETSSAVVTLSVVGTQPVEVVSVNIDGLGSSAGFTQVNDCEGILPGNGQCSIQVDFAPLTLGTYAGTLTVGTSSPAQPTVTLALTGTAVPPPVAVIANGSWSDGTYAQSCLGYLQGDAKHTPATTNGIYTIKPAATPYAVTCNITGGGWTKFENMVSGIMLFPGNSRSVRTERVTAAYLSMYKEIAAVSSVQKVEGVYGVSEARFDFYSFINLGGSTIPGTQVYSGTTPAMNLEITLANDWQKALGATTFSTDSSRDEGGGGYVPGVTWFR